MTQACREMTIKDWIDSLPEGHSARKEYERLISVPTDGKIDKASSAYAFTNAYGDQMTKTPEQYTGPVLTIRPNKFTHEIKLQHGLIMVSFDADLYPVPNWFRRFWYWALLGWTFEEIK